MPENDKDILVSDEARLEATRCNKGFACLQSNGAPLCSVRNCVDEKIHFLACLNDQHCSYARSFGNASYCTCPVRIEIYHRCKM